MFLSLKNSVIETKNIDYVQKNMPFSGSSRTLEDKELEKNEKINLLLKTKFPYANLFSFFYNIDDFSASSNEPISLKSKSETYDFIPIVSYTEEIENINIVNMAPIERFNITLRIKDIKYATPNAIKIDL